TSCPRAPRSSSIRKIGRVKRALVVGGMLVAGVVAVSAVALTRPDPIAQAAADGCTGSGSEMLTEQAPSWVYVNDKDVAASAPPPAPQWIHGIASSPIAALAVHPSGIDNPVIHDAYDVNINVLPDAADSALLGTHNLIGEAED